MTLAIDVISIFPDVIQSYARTSILGRAADAGVWSLRTIDPRDHATGVHRSVDDSPYGGGAGMVMTPGPIIEAIKATPDVHRPVIALSPLGRQLSHDVCVELVATAGFTLLCGRYEGIDQRVIDLVSDDAISLGDFVLAGGELAALCVIESVVRLLPGALGNETSTTDESFTLGLLEYPQYTKPARFDGHEVPAVLLSGDHARIERWRLAQSLHRTTRLRPDLIERRGGLSDAERHVMEEFPDVGV